MLTRIAFAMLGAFILLSAASSTANAQQPSEEFLAERYNNLMDTADRALELANSKAEAFDREFAEFKVAMESDNALVRLIAKRAMLKYVSDMKQQYHTAKTHYIEAAHALKRWSDTYGPPESPDRMAIIHLELQAAIELSGDNFAAASQVRLEILADYF